MMDAQAQDRAHRIGQKNDVRVFRLVSTSPVEERILQRATDKLNMNSLVVEAGNFSKDSKAEERRPSRRAALRGFGAAPRFPRTRASLGCGGTTEPRHC